MTHFVHWVLAYCGFTERLSETHFDNEHNTVRWILCYDGFS